MGIRTVAEAIAFRSYGDVEKVRTTGQTVLGHSEALLKDLETAQSSVRGSLLGGGEADLGPYAAAKDGAYGQLERLQELAPAWSMGSDVAALRLAVDGEFAGLDRAVALQRSGRTREALRLAASRQLDQQLELASKQAERLEQQLKLTMDQRAATANRLNRLLWSYMLVADPIVLLVLLVTIRLVTLRVTHSSAALQRAMAAMSLSAHPEPISRPSDDELGSVVSAFNHMVERLAHEQSERAAAEASLLASNRELTDRERTMNLLLQTSEQLAAVKDQDEFAAVVQRFVPQIIQAHPGRLYVIDGSHTMLQAIASWNSPRFMLERFPVEDCSAAYRGQPHFYSGAGTRSQCAHASAHPDAGHSCVPLISQGETMGILFLEANPSARRFERRNRQRLLLLSDTLGLALGNLRLRERLHTESVRDPLTGVFNRRFLNEVLAFELTRASQTKQPFSLMMLDIDDFKRFNDVYGHETGDIVLKELAETLLQHSRKNDIVCRWGGEEFLLVFPTMGAEAAHERGETLRDAIKKIVVVSEGRRVPQVTVSAGVATYPYDAAEAEGLVAAADRALYEAKRSGRDRVVVAHDSGLDRTGS